MRDERSLDPTDWEHTKALGHRMLDDMFAFLQNVRERPVWRAPDDEAMRAFERPWHATGRDVEAIYREFRDHIMPFTLGNTHPRFWGWVNGTGTVTGMLADMLASGVNGHVTFGNQAPIRVERQVLRWLATLLGFPADTTGLLVSSGSVANLTGLAVARDTAWPDIVANGLGATVTPVLYASDQVHNSVDKAVGVLGIGRSHLRRIPSTRDFVCDVAAIGKAIAEDRKAGRHPMCIVGTACTVNTGAVDDLDALADLASREGLWFHVDAAFGAALAVSTTHRGKLKGLERADSVAFDLHKWFYVPYDVGCVLIRHPQTQRRSFAPPAAYLEPMERGIAAGESFGELGLDLSRGFRALKVWMSLQEHGKSGYEVLIDQNMDQAQYLANAILGSPDLELLAPVVTNVVCFRHRGVGALDKQSLDRHNREILMTLHERGIAAPSFTRIRGAFAIRVAITNHRSRVSDFDALVNAVRSIGREPR